MRARPILLSCVLATLALAPSANAEPQPAECHMHDSRAVSFRNAQAKDVLEISIGNGPCTTATLTIVIWVEETGQVLYTYVAPFRQHVVEAGELKDEARTFVAGVVASPLTLSSDLPPYVDEESYAEQHSAGIAISKEEYEALRQNPRPVFSHPTYFEGWRSVVIDDTTGMAKVVVEGGT